jgi:hypothetical protein
VPRQSILLLPFLAEMVTLHLVVSMGCIDQGKA